MSNDEKTHEYFEKNLNGLSGKVDSILQIIGEVRTEAEGVRKAVEYQNGRVTKLEGRWEKIMYALIVSMAGIVVSLVVYIYNVDNSNNNEQINELMEILREGKNIEVSIDPKDLQDAMDD